MKEVARLLNFLINDADMAKLQGTENDVPISERALDALKSARMLNSLEYSASEEIRSMQDQNEVMIPALEASTVMDIFKDAADKYYDGRGSLDAYAEEVQTEMQES